MLAVSTSKPAKPQKLGEGDIDQSLRLFGVVN